MSMRRLLQCLRNFLLLLSWRPVLAIQVPQENVLSASINIHGQLNLPHRQQPQALDESAPSAQSLEADGSTSRGASHRNSAVSPCLQNVLQRDAHLVGSVNSGPLLYSNILGFKGCVADHAVDLFASDSIFEDIADQPVILGGGGLLNESFDIAMKRFFHNAKGPIAMWGVGLDSYPQEARSGLPSYLQNVSSLKLIGLRDHFESDHPLFSPAGIGTPVSSDGPMRTLGPLLRWVPCASVMHMGFDKYFDSMVLKPPRTTRRIGYVRPLNPIARRGCESLGTDGGVTGFSSWLANGLVTSVDVAPDYLMMEDMLKFLAESEVVVTNSYHAIYWATLLGKKAILCDRWSTQFDHLRWPVTHYSGDLTADTEKAVGYPHAFQEAKEANIAFAEEVRYELGVPGTTTLSVTGLLRAGDQTSHHSGTVCLVAVSVLLGLLVAALLADTVRRRSAAKQKASMPAPPGRLFDSQDVPQNAECSSRRFRAPPAPAPSLLAPRLGGPER